MFFVLLLFLSYKVIGKRNKILDLNSKNISYIELIKYENNTMKTVKDNAQLKKIVSSLNKISGEITQKDSENIENVDFINIYDKSYKKMEIAREGYFLKVDNKWYRINEKGAEIFDQIIKNYK